MCAMRAPSIPPPLHLSFQEKEKETNKTWSKNLSIIFLSFLLVHFTPSPVLLSFSLCSILKPLMIATLKQHFDLYALLSLHVKSS